jgi:uncharacterized membrane protein
MDSEHIIYTLYMVFFLVLVGLIVVTPLISFDNETDVLYKAFSYTCHQKLSRSLCLFSGASGLWIADCTPQTGEYVPGLEDARETKVEGDGYVGYKLPVCARDVGLYAALLLGGALYPVVRQIKDRNIYPAIYLVLALVPLGLDGGVQLLSDLGWIPLVYESTNIIRLLTGGIAGIVSSFYAIPVLINMFCQEIKSQ